MAGKILWSSVILLAVVGFWSWHQEMDKPIFPASFDREKWQHNARSEDGELGTNGIIQTRMANDLITKRALIGKNQAEIKQMLNEPTVFAAESQSSQSRQMRYTLRTHYRAISPIRTDELIIKFDDRGKAATAYVQYRNLPG